MSGTAATVIVILGSGTLLFLSGAWESWCQTKRSKANAESAARIAEANAVGRIEAKKRAERG